ncbi:MAG: glycerate kinase [Clostridia bacterium]|nr:glycerate kinase [Clostridia bacterium]
MRILLCPDSYKGCLSSLEVCAALRKGILEANPNAEIIQYPSSDGGEGFCDCMENLYGGIRICKEVTFPLWNKGLAEFLYCEDTYTAYIELASAAGLNLVPKDKRNILRSTTYGVGELICQALECGAKTVVLGLGGSATNDYGLGMLAAMGAVFSDKNGYFVPPYAENIKEIYNIDTSGMVDISNVNIIAACDVKNPLCGELGAAKVFAKQKGATDLEIEYLDNAVIEFANRFEINLNNKGYGAAGGIGMAIIEFLDGTYTSGASLLVDSTKFITALKSVDMVITGEGNTDSQTVNGKLISVIARRAKEFGVTTWVLSGNLSEGYDKLYDIGVTKCCSLTEMGYDVEYSIKNAKTLIAKRIKEMIM